MSACLSVVNMLVAFSLAGDETHTFMCCVLHSISEETTSPSTAKSLRHDCVEMCAASRRSRSFQFLALEP